MLKNEFLTRLRAGLKGLPQEDIEQWISFYGEIIDDRMEEGLSEGEAVAAVGSVQEIADQVIREIPIKKIAKEKVKSTGRLNAWQVVLLVLGSPVWLSLGIAMLAVIFSVYVSLWAVIVSLWSVFASLAACAVGVFGAGVVFSCIGKVTPGLAMNAAGLMLAGLSVFVFFGCKLAAKGAFWLTKKIAVGVKNCLMGKRGL